MREKLLIRDFEPKDEEALLEIHAKQGLAYDLPLFSDPNLKVRAVLEGYTGKVEMALLLRRTAETYLLVDPDCGQKRDRLGKIMALNNDIRPLAARLGFSDSHLWLPPQMEQGFGKVLLKHFGWKKALWPCYFTELNNG